MSDRTAWLTWRREGIGASDVAGILGLSNWSSPWKVWAEKTGLLPLDDEMTDRQDFGLLMEPVLAKMFERARPGLSVAGEQTWCTHPGLQWPRCTVDGFVFDGLSDETVERAAAGLEIKTDGRFGWPDGVPPNYQAQAQWGMFVTGLPKWYFAVLHAGFRFEVYELERDPKDIEFMAKRVEAFWRENVVAGIAPEVDGSEATLDALAAVYPNHTPGVRADVAEMADEIERWQRLSKQATSIKKMAEDAKAKVIAAVGDAELGCIDDVPVVSLRSSTRQSYVVAETTYRTLRPASKNDLKETA